MTAGKIRRYVRRRVTIMYSLYRYFFLAFRLLYDRSPPGTELIRSDYTTATRNRGYLIHLPTCYSYDGKPVDGLRVTCTYYQPIVDRPRARAHTHTNALKNCLHVVYTLYRVILSSFTGKIIL